MNILTKIAHKKIIFRGCEDVITLYQNDKLIKGKNIKAVYGSIRARICVLTWLILYILSSVITCLC